MRKEDQLVTDPDVAMTKADVLAAFGQPDRVWSRGRFVVWDYAGDRDRPTVLRVVWSGPEMIGYKTGRHLSTDDVVP